MFKLAVITPKTSDSTSLYRAWGPFSALEDHVKLFMLSDTTTRWPELSGIDCLFFHRPNRPEHFQIIRMAKDLGKKIWLDFDDDLFNIDASNDAYEHYNEMILNDMRLICMAANKITVSTQGLFETYVKVNKNTEVVRNEIPIHIVNKMLWEKPVALNSRAVCWRGTKHHAMNIMHYRNEFRKLVDGNENQWPFIFMGLRPYPIREFFPYGKLFEVGAPFQWDYFRELRKNRCAVHVVCLKDTKFNRAKSNIAYQEALLFANSLCVVPDMPEWNQLNGVIIYKKDEELANRVQYAIDMKDKTRSAMVAMARKSLVSDLQEMRYAQRRLEICRELKS